MVLALALPVTVTSSSTTRELLLLQKGLRRVPGPHLSAPGQDDIRTVYIHVESNEPQCQHNASTLSLCMSAIASS